MNVAKVFIIGIPSAVIVAIIGAYVGLVLDGSVPPPDLQGIANSIVPVARGGMAAAIGLIAVVVIFCTVMAPLLFALRSADPLAIVVSLVLTVGMIGVFLSGKSVIQEILGALIYIANIILSTIVYAVRRIETRV